jgi:hypothetical protein
VIGGWKMDASDKMGRCAVDLKIKRRKKLVGGRPLFSSWRRERLWDRWDGAAAWRGRAE